MPPSKCPLPLESGHCSLSCCLCQYCTSWDAGVSITPYFSAGVVSIGWVVALKELLVLVVVKPILYLKTNCQLLCNRFKLQDPNHFIP